MAKRKKFDLDKAEWRANPKLRAASASERAWWLDLCLLFDDSDEPGILRWDLNRIAKSLGCSLDVLMSLVDQQILKGAPAGQVCESLVHTDRYGRQVELISATQGPIWYSSRVVRDGYLRRVSQDSGRKGATKHHRSGQRTIRGAHPQGYPIGCFENTPEGAPNGCVNGQPKHRDDNGLHENRTVASETGPPGPFPPTPPLSQEILRERDIARAREAEALSAARSFATGWITAECPSHLRTTRISNFVRLILRDGQERAVELVKIAMADPGVREPFSYALTMEVPTAAATVEAAPPAAGNGERSNGRRRTRHEENMDEIDKALAEWKP